MNHKVVFSLFHVFVNRGFSVLRFNTRGVGRSQGRFDNGMGELSDAAAALDWLQSMNADAKSCWIAGYSFRVAPLPVERHPSSVERGMLGDGERLAVGRLRLRVATLAAEAEREVGARATLVVRRARPRAGRPPRRRDGPGGRPRRRARRAGRRPRDAARPRGAALPPPPRSGPARRGPPRVRRAGRRRRDAAAARPHRPRLLGPASPASQAARERDVRGHERRAPLERLAQRDQSLVVPSLTLEGHAEVIPGARVVRRHAQCFAQRVPASPYGGGAGGCGRAPRARAPSPGRRRAARGSGRRVGQPAGAIERKGQSEVRACLAGGARIASRNAAAASSSCPWSRSAPPSASATWPAPARPPRERVGGIGRAALPPEHARERLARERVVGPPRESARAAASAPSQSCRRSSAHAR